LSTLKYWVWLSSLTELKPKTRVELLEAFGDPESIYYADDRQLLERCPVSDHERSLLRSKSLDHADEILEKCSADGVTLCTIRDAIYPKRLYNIYDPPVMLYIKGKLPAIDEEAAIAVVGTRKATPYGIKMGRGMGYEIIRGGGLVVTGLAAGVDSAAAEGALRAGGSCIGVLGCAIDDIYPKYSDMLFEDVAAAGALVSEYPPGTPIFGRNFPERNRIMSGLSVGVTVIEAPIGSGALITASRALDQGREVFAVPGNADAPNCRGSNGLIRDGAILVTCGWDVLCEFESRFPAKLSKPDLTQGPDFDAVLQTGVERSDRLAKIPPETGEGFAKLREKKGDRKNIDKQKRRDYIDLKEQLSGLSEAQLKIVAAMDEHSKHVDDIIEAAGLPASAVLSELTVLQIKGFVKQENGKRFSLSIDKI
jgi:DNA processing protein